MNIHSQKYLVPIFFVIPTVHFFLLVCSLEDQRKPFSNDRRAAILDFRRQGKNDFFLNFIVLFWRPTFDIWRPFCIRWLLKSELGTLYNKRKTIYCLSLLVSFFDWSGRSIAVCQPIMMFINIYWRTHFWTEKCLLNSEHLCDFCYKYLAFLVLLPGVKGGQS